MEVIENIVEKFRQISLFKGMREDVDALRRMAALVTVHKYTVGSEVLREGETGDTMFIIKIGTVEVVKKTKAGDMYTVAHLSGEQNMFFGEMALIDDDRRSAGVVCKTDCEMYLLKREDFYSLGDKYPAFGLAVTRELSKIVSNRLRKANGDIITLFDALVGEVIESGGLS